MARTIEKTAPSAPPPKTGGTDVSDPTSNADAPALPMDQIVVAQAKAPAAGPALTPPAEIAVARGDEAIGAWHNAVKITAVWSNSSARNAWAAVAGLGWRRINPANDSAFLAISLLLSHARQMDTTCNLRIEADELIHEAYVW